MDLSTLNKLRPDQLVTFNGRRMTAEAARRILRDDDGAAPEMARRPGPESPEPVERHANRWRLLDD
jgi:hypothetical protein